MSLNASKSLRFSVLITILVMLGVDSLDLSASHAQYPGLNGKIAFHREDVYTGRFEIWTVNPDGSEPTLLTGSLGDSANPDWSPSGRRIAFQSDPGGPSIGSDDIYVMNSDGSDPMNLTNSSTYDASPSWSPDGSRIAFLSNRTGLFTHIWIMNSDGSNPTQLTPDGAGHLGYSSPAWSPDGTKIAFQSDSQDIYVMNADGTGVVQLTTHPSFDGNPNWAPAGDSIIFTSSRDGTLEAWEMNADSTDQRQVTNIANSGDNRDADVSPDGQYIVYSKDPGLGGPERRVWIAARDGSNEYPITSAFSDDSPDWQVTPESETPAPTPEFTPTATPSPTPTSKPTLPPSQTPSPGRQVAWGDANCSGSADPVDALLTLRDDAGLSTNTGECPDFGTPISILASALAWGDIDCSGGVDPVDALKLLRFDAALGVNQPQGCPALGVEVTISVNG